MCFGGRGAAKPTVNAAKTVNQVQAPVTREPWGPNYDIMQARAKEGAGVRGNILRPGHLRNRKALTDPATLSTKLGGPSTGPGATDDMTTRGKPPGFNPVATLKRGVTGLFGEVERLVK